MLIGVLTWRTGGTYTAASAPSPPHILRELPLLHPARPSPTPHPPGNGFFALYFGLFASLRLSMSLLDKPDTEPVKTYEEA